MCGGVRGNTAPSSSGAGEVRLLGSPKGPGCLFPASSLDTHGLKFFGLVSALCSLWSHSNYDHQVAVQAWTIAVLGVKLRDFPPHLSGSSA